MCVYVYMYVCTYILVHTWLDMYVYMYIFMCIYTHVYTYISTPIPTSTHIQHTRVKSHQRSLLLSGLELTNEQVDKQIQFSHNFHTNTHTIHTGKPTSTQPFHFRSWFDERTSSQAHTYATYTSKTTSTKPSSPFGSWELTLMNDIACSQTYICSIHEQIHVSAAFSFWGLTWWANKFTTTCMQHWLGGYGQ